MTEPAADTDDDDERVRVARRYDGFGRPIDYIDVDPDTAGQWDVRQWHDKPPS